MAVAQLGRSADATEAVDAVAPNRGRVDADRLAPFLAGPLTLAIAACCLLYSLGLRAPDLAAQTARALAAANGAWLTWTGWYGGVDLAPYSLISGPLMDLLGVAAVGVSSVLAITVCSSCLVRGLPRARLMSLTAALMASVNLYSGRVTYGLGIAIALGALVLLQRRRVTAAVLVSATAGLASPLAALALGTAAAAVVLTARGTTRRDAISVGVATAVPVIVIGLLFPGAAHMPSPLGMALPGIGVPIVIALLADRPAIRITGALMSLTALGSLCVTSAVGSNADRLPLLTAPVLLIGFVRPPKLGAITALLALVWVGISLGIDLQYSRDPSAGQAYYASLIHQLQVRGTTGRVEVVDPATHGADAYVANAVPLARGWERQLDVAQNPIFYNRAANPLNATTYGAWLVEHGVQWVALPSAPLDYASVAEGALVSRRLPYLQPTWHDRDWQLFQVVSPIAG